MQRTAFTPLIEPNNRPNTRLGSTSSLLYEPSIPPHVQVIKQLAPHLRLVVATGGGAVLRPMNWSYMQQVRICICCYWFRTC